MQKVLKHYPRLTIAMVEIFIALGILIFWVVFFIFRPVPFTNFDKVEIYRAFEHAFVIPDVVLAIFLLWSGYSLLRGSTMGCILSIIAGGMLVFLGLLDVSFNIQQGIYSTGISAALVNGIINACCILGGGLLIKFGSKQLHTPLNSA
ncbi:MAG: hypothetical protein D6732_07195 [Methanobacteriota archaeon]|nr:MAG: hypothetical protein D6732_07195 [Euryarchaeota archaeon]